MGKAWGYNTALCSPQRSRCSRSLVVLSLPGSSTVLTQLYHFPVAFSIKVRGVEPPSAPKGYLKNWAQLCSRDSVGICEEIPSTSSATVLNILPFFSSPPTPLHAHKPQPSLLTQPLSLFFSLFIAFPFFPGCNQEKIWDQRLPICSGEWHSVVWVSTLLFPGTSLKPLIQMEALCSPPGLLSNVSVTDISQADPLPGSLFVCRPHKVSQCFETAQ